MPLSTSGYQPLRFKIHLETVDGSVSAVGRHVLTVLLECGVHNLVSSISRAVISGSVIFYFPRFYRINKSYRLRSTRLLLLVREKSVSIDSTQEAI